ncbi:hypothetical protein Pan97_47820 [Bremerella volcania]|uniref:Zinc-ribbon domain-containing protein n=1 Tax=Bremerella volcania TaxID=2527984 RepID=A0A518CEQ8_9BACT|nr:hypothetical protein [Bremerella volcania]QDU77709.1 hypothetical protein Pan97_47820 [Bremerella volcania]
MSVVCSNCGEELMGAVNRCWKCGTPFIRSETVRTSGLDGSGSTQTVQLQVPPIRRAPVLAIYLAPEESEEDEPIAAIIEEETEETETVPSYSQAVVPTVRRFIDSLPLDYPSLGSSILALLANIVCYYSILGVLLAAVAVISNVYLLSHRRSTTRWVGFGISILSLLSALTRTVASLYLWFTGMRLTMALFG